jgi:hypothetical protein
MADRKQHGEPMATDGVASYGSRARTEPHLAARESPLLGKRAGAEEDGGRPEN